MDFTLKNKKGAFVAKASIVKPESKRPGMMIKSGSRMYKEVISGKKWQDCPWIDRSRNELIENNLVEYYNLEYYVLKKDVLFTSPNRAACAMLGYITASAWHEFINDEGLSLDEVYRSHKDKN